MSSRIRARSSLARSWSDCAVTLGRASSTDSASAGRSLRNRRSRQLLAGAEVRARPGAALVKRQRGRMPAELGQRVGDPQAVGHRVGDVERLLRGAQLALRVELLDHRLPGGADVAVVLQRRQDLDDEISERARHRQEHQGHDPDRVPPAADHVDDAENLQRENGEIDDHAETMSPRRSQHAEGISPLAGTP